jgi:hypothetical protein
MHINMVRVSRTGFDNPDSVHLDKIRRELPGRNAIDKRFPNQKAWQPCPDEDGSAARVLIEEDEKEFLIEVRFSGDLWLLHKETWEIWDDVLR